MDEAGGGCEGDQGGAWRPVAVLASAEFPKAWAFYDVRPPSTPTGDTRKTTKRQYCRFDETFDYYVYSKAFVDLVVADCAAMDGFEAVIGWAPQPVTNAA